MTKIRVIISQHLRSIEDREERAFEAERIARRLEASYRRQRETGETPYWESLKRELCLA